jgi:hypothetical protein
MQKNKKEQQMAAAYIGLNQSFNVRMYTFELWYATVAHGPQVLFDISRPGVTKLVSR